jgi:hypothetical protein
MKKLLSVLLLMAALTSAATVEAKNHVFAGSIGPYKIHMVLNDQMQGYYYYDNRPNSHFKLVVSSNRNCSDGEHGPGEACSKLTLQEYAPGGKNSGQFVGTYLSSYAYGSVGSEFTGVFTNKSNGKRYSFEVYCSE